MPGHRIAKRQSTAEADAKRKTAPSDAGTPSLQKLQHKYRRARRDSSNGSGMDNSETDDDDIVAIEPDDDTSDTLLRRKTVVISGKEKRIVGKQG
jgi:hypothetical protein